MNYRKKAVLLAVALLGFHLGICAQSLSLKMQNVSVKKAMTELQAKSGYSFVYIAGDVDTDRKVSVDADQLQEAIKQILQGQQVTYEIQGKNVVVRKIASQSNAVKQERKVSGTVKDANGEPIIGANVTVKGDPSIGTITDIDGRFSLDVPVGAVLQVSFIGFASQDVEVGKRKELSVTMSEDTEMLDEVVVVGYGTAKKSDLAGAVVRADLNTLQESPNVSLGSALQGIIPGLNVGAVTQAGKNPSISIRGRNSISGGTSPLIVLDGIIYRGDLVDINMNDVESIDVLKDASAAAIYGSEASNGVILVTSKTGKTTGKPIIEYNGSFSYQQPTNKDLYPTGREGFLQRIADRFLEESRSGDDLLTPNPNWDVTKHLMDGNVLNGYLNGVDTDWWDIQTSRI